MQIKLMDFKLNNLGNVDLNKDVFGVSWHPYVVSMVVRWQRAKAQAGTHASKTISQVSGTTRKPYKQKGTGNARQGSLRSAQFRGGGVSFGPVPRSHAIDLPKKVRKLGLRVALSHKVQNGRVLVFKDFVMDEYSTRQVKDVCNALNLTKVLFVGTESDRGHFAASVRNINHADFLPVAGLNVYDIIRKDNLVVSEAAIKEIEGRLL